MLDSFCGDVNLRPIAKHSQYSVDYTYNFDIIRFNFLDHILLSDIILKHAASAHLCMLTIFRTTNQLYYSYVCS